MATAYLYFGKPVNADTITALVQACRVLVNEKDANGAPLWDHFHLEIASGGGDLIAGFAGYNILTNLPVKVTTHNCGAVDSAAIMLFLAGVQRIASALSAFHFHQSAWTFAAAGQPINVISAANKWLGRYEDLVPRHRGFDRLIFGHSRIGRCCGATRSSMLRATPG
jgi:ATP-dependent protease ClpP protease subunit